MNLIRQETRIKNVLLLLLARLLLVLNVNMYILMTIKASIERENNAINSRSWITIITTSRWLLLLLLLQITSVINFFKPNNISSLLTHHRRLVFKTLRWTFKTPPPLIWTFKKIKLVFKIKKRILLINPKLLLINPKQW